MFGIPGLGLDAPLGGLIKRTVFTTVGITIFRKDARTSKANVVLRGSGGYGNSLTGAGGAQGGLAVKLVDMTGLSEVAVQIANNNSNSPGSATKFGEIFYATGAVYYVPGDGVGGDFNIRGVPGSISGFMGAGEGGAYSPAFAGVMGGGAYGDTVGGGSILPGSGYCIIDEYA